MKNDENCISATAETEEMPQNSFPTPWKWKKCLKMAFQPLENGKKRLKTAFQPLGNGKKIFKTAFQPLGNGRNASKRLSNPLEAER